MEIFEDAKVDGKNLVLSRSKVTEMGGFLGFFVRFLRIYKESNTFDSYIDPDTRLVVKHEVYKLNDDGSKIIQEFVSFDRARSRIISQEETRTIINNVPPDTQDGFSIFLELIHRVNTEDLLLGKVFRTNLCAYKKISKVEIKLTDITMDKGSAIYTLRIEKLPDIFKHPATLSFRITDRNGIMLPIDGECILHIPIFPDVKIKGKLRTVISSGQ